MKPLQYIEAIEPYQPGKPIEEVERELGIPNAAKLASNENPIGPSPKALTAILGALAELHRYPDGPGTSLREKLAAKLGLRPQMLILGNGSDEIISMIVQTFVGRGGEVLTGKPSFLEYRLIAQAHGARCVEIPLVGFRYDLEGLLRRVTGRTRVIFIANPNNPTATYVTHREVERFLSRLPRSVITVVDEAYYEFVDQQDFPRSVELFKHYPIMILRTFSKAYGLSGIRIGYGIARSEWVDWMNRVRQPFNVNRLAQVAALAALGDGEHVRRSRAAIQEGKHYLVHELGRLGCECVPSAANFLLINVHRDGRRLFHQLLKEGVIVRDMAAYDLTRFIRVTVGTMPENRRLVEALEKVKGKRQKAKPQGKR